MLGSDLDQLLLEDALYTCIYFNNEMLKWQVNVVVSCHYEMTVHVFMGMVLLASLLRTVAIRTGGLF